MRRGFTFTIVFLLAVVMVAGARRVAASNSVGRFVCYYEQVKDAPTPTTFWERVAASVALTRASTRQALALN